jgi:hypothetical protein
VKLASFRKHPNGTWEYRIRYKDRATGKYKETGEVFERGKETTKARQVSAFHSVLCAVYSFGTDWFTDRRSIGIDVG